MKLTTFSSILLGVLALAGCAADPGNDRPLTTWTAANSDAGARLASRAAR